jgi:hypothetical protein
MTHLNSHGRALSECVETIPFIDCETIPSGFITASTAPDLISHNQAGAPGQVHFEEVSASEWDAEPPHPPFRSNQAVISAVEDWHIKSVGCRPIDYMGRDLLLGGLFGDHRPVLFRRLVEEPPDWAQELVAPLPGGKSQKQALHHAVLHYLHRQHLIPQQEHSWREGDNTFIGSESYRKLMDRLWRCWPYGMEVEWAGSGKRSPRDVCGLSKFCPWCYARSVVRLHKRLGTGPLREPEGKLLVLGRSVILSCEAGFGYSGVLTPEEVEYVRSELGGQVRRRADELGVRGGLLTHQIQPGRQMDVNIGELHNCFRHELAVLGEMAVPKEDEWQTVEKLLNVGPRAPDRPLPRYGSLLDAPDGSIPLFWLLMPAEDPLALRFLLLGSWPGYLQNPLNWKASYGDNFYAHPLYRFRENGLVGAFTTPLWFMYDADQWSDYVRCLYRQRRLYDVFGSWRGLPQPEKTSLLLPANRHKRLWVIRNCKRRRKAQETRQELLRVAAPLWSQVIAEPTQGPGRPPHRRRLGELLRQHGHAVSTDMLSELVKALKGSD